MAITKEEQAKIKWILDINWLCERHNLCKFEVLDALKNIKTFRTG